MEINGKRYPLIGVWIEERGKPVRQCYSTAYLDEASYQACYNHATVQLRHGAISASLRAYAMDHYHKDGTHTKGHSVTLDILDYRSLPENAESQEAFWLDA